RVERLMAEYSERYPGNPAPIDLNEVARIAGVTSIREIEMIPEGYLAVSATGFEISLQSNFKEVPGLRRRQRFSLAHEIAHTLFYERREGTLRPRRDAPTGDRLESACHKAAGSLLVPSAVLRAAIREMVGFPSARYLLQLIARFDVSPEVLVRRVHEVFPQLF